MEEIVENNEIIKEPVEEIVEEVPLLKPKRIMKKFERTEKQKEAFAKTMQKRAENVELRKQAKKVEAAKLLLELEQQKEKQAVSKPVQEKKVKTKPKILLPKSDSELETDEDSESEEEIYYTKSRKSIKTPKKVYILKKDIIEEESDDEPIKPKTKFKSQQNKKSVIKVTENSNKNTYPQYKNYFCD
jgi:hypothetical protein